MRIFEADTRLGEVHGQRSLDLRRRIGHFCCDRPRVALRLSPVSVHASSPLLSRTSADVNIANDPQRQTHAPSGARKLSGSFSPLPSTYSTNISNSAGTVFHSVTPCSHSSFSHCCGSRSASLGGRSVFGWEADLSQGKARS